MNHFVSLIILALLVAVVFTLVTKEGRREQIRYFAMLLIYLVLGSFVVAWIMYLIP